MFECSSDSVMCVADHENGSFANVADKLDVFVPSHFFGWWVKVSVSMWGEEGVKEGGKEGGRWRGRKGGREEGRWRGR